MYIASYNISMSCYCIQCSLYHIKYYILLFYCILYAVLLFVLTQEYYYYCYYSITNRSFSFLSGIFFLMLFFSLLMGS